MYVIVRLLKGFPQPLIYKVPQHITPLHVGRVVEVPLKAHYKPAVVLKVCAQRPRVSYEIKEVHSVHEMPADEQFQQFITQLARIYFTQPLHFYQRLRSFVQHDNKHERAEQPPVSPSEKECMLNR